MDPEVSDANLEALNKLVDDVKKLNQQWKRFGESMAESMAESLRIQAACKDPSMDEKYDRIIAMLEKMMPTPNSESEPELCVPVETEMVDKSIEVTIKSDSAVATDVFDLCLDVSTIDSTQAEVISVHSSSMIALSKKEIKNEKDGLEFGNTVCLQSWYSPQSLKHTPIDFKSVLVPKIDDKRHKSKDFESGTTMSRSLNFCTEHVRRNVCEIFPFFLPPAKPPEIIRSLHVDDLRALVVNMNDYYDEESSLLSFSDLWKHMRGVHKFLQVKVVDGNYVYDKGRSDMYGNEWYGAAVKENMKVERGAVTYNSLLAALSKYELLNYSLPNRRPSSLPSENVFKIEGYIKERKMSDIVSCLKGELYPEDIRNSKPKLHLLVALISLCATERSLSNEVLIRCDMVMPISELVDADTGNGISKAISEHFYINGFIVDGSHQLKLCSSIFSPDSKSVAMETPDLCINGVQQYAPEILIHTLLPPAKPPDGFFPDRELLSDNFLAAGLTTMSPTHFVVPCFLNDIIDALLEVLSDPSNEGFLITRRLCVLLNAEKVFRQLSSILQSETDLEFASLMVQASNLILLTSSERSELRCLLKESLVTPSGKDLFVLLYASWCHSPVSLISLCLLAQTYQHASMVIQSLVEEDINVKFLVQLDKLINLLETPVFAYLILQLLEPTRCKWLWKALYGLLMLLPQQSAAFKILKTRLKVVPSFSFSGEYYSYPSAQSGTIILEDGYTEHVYVYRLATTPPVEERILKGIIGRVTTGTCASTKNILKLYSWSGALAFVSQICKSVLDKESDHEIWTSDQIESNIVRCSSPEYVDKMIDAIDDVQLKDDANGGSVICIDRTASWRLGILVPDELEFESFKVGHKCHYTYYCSQLKLDIIVMGSTQDVYMEFIDSHKVRRCSIFWWNLNSVNELHLRDRVTWEFWMILSTSDGVQMRSGAERSLRISINMSHFLKMMLRVSRCLIAEYATAKERKLFVTALLQLNFSLDELVSLKCFISKIFLFSLPRPPEIDDLEDKVDFKGRGMLRTQYYINKGV